jgi:hypothetical protein
VIAVIAVDVAICSSRVALPAPIFGFASLRPAEISSACVSHLDAIVVLARGSVLREAAQSGTRRIEFQKRAARSSRTMDDADLQGIRCDKCGRKEHPLPESRALAMEISLVLGVDGALGEIFPEMGVV